MANSENNNGKPYDLEERTALFGEAIIEFARKVPVDPVTTRLIPQLVAAGTSGGANYCEADDYDRKLHYHFTWAFGCFAIVLGVWAFSYSSFLG